MSQPLKSALKSSKQTRKSVTFNEDGNQVFTFIKDQQENMTLEEKRAFISRLQMYRTGFFFDDEDEEVAEEVVEEIRPAPTRSRIPGYVGASEPEKIGERKTFNGGKKVKQDERDLIQTYGGKAYEMMKKMGFKPGQGLGVNGQGIVAPIQSVSKKALTGEADYSNSNSRYLEEVEEETEESLIPTQDPSMKLYEKQWQKKNKLKQKQDEVIKEHEPNHINLNRNAILRKVQIGEYQTDKISIIDMTQPDTQILEDIQQAFITKTQEADIKHASTRESYQEGLIQLNEINLSLSSKIDKLYTKINRMESNIKSEKDKLIMFDHEISEKTAYLEEHKKILSAKQEFVRHLENLQEYYENTQPKNIEALIERFKALFQMFPREFVEMNVQMLALKLISAEADIQINRWEGPLSGSAADQLLQEHRIFTRLLELLKEVYISSKTEKLTAYARNMGDKKSFKIRNTAISTQDLRNLKRFSAYLMKTVIRKFRHYVVNHWVPEQEKDFYLLDFIQCWVRPVIYVETDELDSKRQAIQMLTKEQEQEAFEQLIIPRLSQSINNWSIKSQESLFHTWLLSWYVYIRELKLHTEIDKIIFAKISQTLQQWQPHQHWAFSFVSPWQNFVEADKWDNLMLRQVVPKLMVLIEESFEVNPAGQDLKTLKICLQWVEVLTDELVGIVFEPIVLQVEQVMEKWRGNGGDISEMKLWIQGWTQVLQPVCSRVMRLKNIINSLAVRL